MIESAKKISVLVVNLNNLNYTKDCISDLLEQDCEFDLTIVDQNSTEEGTEDYFSSLSSEIEIIRNSYNKPLNHIWNWFVEKSNTPYICLLNNDVRIAPNFLSSAVELLDKEKSVGFVNHVTNNSNYQEWSSELKYSIIESPYRQGWDPIFRKSCFSYIPNELSFFYGDDYIYSKLYTSGFKGAYVLNSPMIHYESSTTVEKGGQKDCSPGSPDSTTFHSLDLEHKNLTFIESLSKWKPDFNNIKAKNLKEIYLILYHNNKSESISHLRRLIDEVKKRNKKFIICSHSTIPQDMIDQSESYLYDSNNFTFDSGQRYIYWISIGEQTLYSPYLYYGSLSHVNYSLAAIKNFLNGVSTAFQLGYDIVHSIEYDCIPNFDDLDDNYNLLSNFGSVVYKDDIHEMLGHVFSVRIESDLNLRWNEEYWIDEIKKDNCFSEKFIFNLLNRWSNGKTITKNPSIQTKSKISSIGSIQTVLFEENGILKVFVINSDNKKLENIKIYYSNGKLETELYPDNWKIFTLGEGISFIDVFLEDKLIRNWDISDDEKYSKYVRVNKMETKND